MAKLTNQQWAKLKKRRDNGESTTALAKEFGITREAIYQKLGNPKKEQKEAANQILAATESLHISLQNFTPSVQSAGWDMARDFIEISQHSCGGAKYSAKTFEIFAMIANEKAQESLLLGAEQGIVAKELADKYQDSANNAFKPVANLIAANKDRISPEKENSIIIHGGLPETSDTQDSGVTISIPSGF